MVISKTMKSDEHLAKKIADKTVRIGIIGLGYVGLPLAVLFAKKGFKVSGFIRDRKKIGLIKQGKSYITDPFVDEFLPHVVKKGMLCAFSTEDRTALGSCDVYIICVPTPVAPDKTPDITAFRSVARLLASLDLTGKLIINESTVAPGMTRDVFGTLGGTYFLVCSPERVDPGNDSKSTEVIPKVMGGRDKESLSLGSLLYSQVLKGTLVAVSTLESAELTKMLENTYRAVNIALSNEFALLAEKMGIDIVEVINAAKTKWSYQAHYPSIGVGGHCIPVDPYYIVQYANTHGVDLPVVFESLKQNEDMPRHLAEKVTSNYKKGNSVVVYGITYKKNVGDMRESPVVEFCHSLSSANIPFSVYDPYVPDEELTKLSLKKGRLSIVDILIVGTDHDTLKDDYKKLIGEHTLVVDGRNFFPKKVGRAVIGVGRMFV